MNRALKAAGFTERRFQTGEVELNFAEGPPAGPPLVLIPGQTMPWQSYTRVLPELSRHFHVFALDVRGHGRSGATPGRYTFGAMARDVTRLLEGVVKAPAIISGNSSGGVIAVGAAALAPHLVRGVVPEDPPLFSCEYPRIRECFVWHVLERAVRNLGGPGPRDVAGFFRGFEVPVQGDAKIMRFPTPAVWFVAAVLRVYRWLRPTGPIDLPFLPLNVRLFVRGLSEYDPDFSRAFLSDAAHRDFSHEAVLRQVKCPVRLLRADWFEHPTLGLVGAMSQAEVERVKRCAPQTELVEVHGAHVLHVDQPRAFVQQLVAFARTLPATEVVPS